MSQTNSFFDLVPVPVYQYCITVKQVRIRSRICNFCERIRINAFLSLSQGRDNKKPHHFSCWRQGRQLFTEFFNLQTILGRIFSFPTRLSFKNNAPKHCFKRNSTVIGEVDFWIFNFLQFEIDWKNNSKF
jgi:hypothetical protein